jgi:hypothetical protein
VLTVVGEPVDEVLVLGPAPLDDLDGSPSLQRDEADGTLLLGESF